MNWGEQYIIGSNGRDLVLLPQLPNSRRMKTIRREVLERLTDEPRSVSSLARELGLHRDDAEDELRHALRSAAAQGWSVTVVPARCRTCGFSFDKTRLSKPGKCPRCRGSRLFEPQISLSRA
jgi:transcriptional regulator